MRRSRGLGWKFEVFKMGMYIYIPIFVWYIYNSDYIQRHYVYPRLKTTDYELYKKMMLDEDDDNP